MDHYYDILGLESGASEARIKGAYRRLAKKYHPDISKEPNAEERFIEITEAYQILLEGPTVYNPGIAAAEKEEVYRSREDLRKERARAFARMRYEKFKKNNEAFRKSWYYGPVKLAVYLMIVLFYSLAVAMLLAPLLVWVIAEESGLVIPMAVVSLLGLIVLKHARDLHKEVRPYLDKYRQ